MGRNLRFRQARSPRARNHRRPSCSRRIHQGHDLGQRLAAFDHFDEGRPPIRSSRINRRNREAVSRRTASNLFIRHPQPRCSSNTKINDSQMSKKKKKKKKNPPRSKKKKKKKKK